MTIEKQALVLLNPRAGAGNAEQVRQILESSLHYLQWAVEVREIPKDTPAAVLAQEIAQAHQRGVTLVIAAGGDGTASKVAQAIIRSGQAARVRLGLFPSGTANSLALELGIPTEWSESARFLASTEETIPLDAMQMGEEYFFLRIGIGLDAETIRETSRPSKKRFGRWAYFGTLLTKLGTTKRYRFRCKVDGRKRKFFAVQVFLANGGRIALAPFRLGPNIDLSDGIVNVCAYDALTWWDYLGLLWKLFRRDYQHQPQLKYWPARDQIEIKTRFALPVQGDGEPLGTTPLCVKIVPGAVRVVAVRRAELG